MSALGLKIIDETVHLTNIWLKDLMQRTGWEDKQRVYRLLRATMHALRDRLSPEEAVHLGAQLPMLIRGLYFEGWRVTGKPLTERTVDAFVAHVRKEFGTDLGSDAEAEKAVRAVFALLSDKISKGEMEDVRHTMPRPLRELFPASAGAA